MKKLAYIALLLGWITNVSYAQSNPGITLEQVVQLLSKTEGVGVVGWESIPESRQNITDSDALRETIARTDIAKAAKIITDETDYECQFGKGYILICPKLNPSLHDLPLSLRKVSFPEATNLPFTQFLRQIKNSDPKYGVFLGNGGQYMGQLLSGAVTLKAGQGDCYEVLNNLATQLKANYWIMLHLTLFDPETKKTLLPMKLKAGLLSFFSNGVLNAKKGIWFPMSPPGAAPSTPTNGGG